MTESELLLRRTSPVLHEWASLIGSRRLAVLGAEFVQPEKNLRRHRDQDRRRRATESGGASQKPSPERELAGTVRQSEAKAVGGQHKDASRRHGLVFRTARLAATLTTLAWLSALVVVQLPTAGGSLLGKTTFLAFIVTTVVAVSSGVNDRARAGRMRDLSIEVNWEEFDGIRERWGPMRGRRG